MALQVKVNGIVVIDDRRFTLLQNQGLSRPVKATQLRCIVDWNCETRHHSVLERETEVCRIASQR